MHIVLFEPEIPPNTGNIARLCAATGTDLHLIEPLGFSLEDRYLKRAGLDYWPHVKVKVWKNFDSYLAEAGQNMRHIATSSRQGLPIHRFDFSRNDALIFGPETRGLPPEIVAKAESCVRIPIWGQVRSINLATAAGIVLYQAFAHCGILDEVGEAPPPQTPPPRG